MEVGVLTSPANGLLHCLVELLITALGMEVVG